MNLSAFIPDPHAAHGKDYDPYIKVHEIPSTGRVSRPTGWKTGRTHHILSGLECRLFYLFEWAPEVIDIREQFKLHLEETRVIADELGIQHPIDPKTREWFVMTTDFVLTLATGGDIAVSAKYEEKVSSRRVAEKLEIERVYWEKHNTPWKLATEKKLPMGLVENVEWIHNAINLEFDPDEAQAAQRLLEGYLAKGASLRKASAETEKTLCLEPGYGLNLTRHLLATRRWETNMLEKIKPANPLELTHYGIDRQYIDRVA